MNALSITVKILSIICKILLTLIFYLIISFSLYISAVEVVSVFLGIFFYVVVVSFVIFTIYAVFKKRLYVLILTILLWFVLSFTIFFDIIFARDVCLDTSVCDEGLQINTEYGLIEVNKENCEKYGWEWREKGKVCNMRDKN